MNILTIHRSYTCIKKSPINNPSNRRFDLFTGLINIIIIVEILD